MSSSNPSTGRKATLFTRLRRGFSPSRWLRSAEGLRRIAEGGSGHEWVLARGLCAYTTLDGAAVPARKRRGFADMAVARWAPFANPQSHVEWMGDRAMVWAWSRDAILDAGQDAEPLAAPRRVLPESLYRGEPQREGEELVAMDAGCEGRVWRAGMLVATRWWSQPPMLGDWNEFRRGAGLQPAMQVPEPLPFPLAERPWSAPQLRGFGEVVGQQRRLLLVLATGLGAAAVGALLVACIALKVSIWQVDRDIQAREQALDKIIAAREGALAGRSAIEKTLALRPPAGQVQLLSAVNRAMRGTWQLVEWKMSDADNLQLTANMPAADPRAIVTAWEASGQFADVTAEMGAQRNQVVVKARVLRATQKARR
jgi:hypothetical protein